MRTKQKLFYLGPKANLAFLFQVVVPCLLILNLLCRTWGIYLDYCNTLYVGINHSVLAYLQLLQNTATHFLSNTPRYEDISATLQCLYWQPVKFTVDVKVLISFRLCMAVPHHIFLGSFTTTQRLSGLRAILLCI